MSQPSHNSLLGLDMGELARLAEELNQPAYRAQQLFESLYRQRAESTDQISTLPSQLRRELVDRRHFDGLASDRE